MNKLSMIAAAAISVATFGIAAAYAEGSNDFTQADANKDNLVSFSEAQGVYNALTQALFDQVDANKDGNLDEAEYGSLTGLTAGMDGMNTPSSSQASSAMDTSSSSGGQGDGSSSSAQ